MSDSIELQVHIGGVAVHSVPLGSRPIHIGRAPHNDLVLSAEQVSWHHATAWIEAGRVWIRDLDSSNGTFIGERQLRGADVLPSGEPLSIGGAITLILAGGAHSTRQPLAWLVEDVASGVRVSVKSERFVVGSGEHADLHFAAMPPRAATLLFHPNGEVWLGTGDTEAPIEAADIFTVAGRELRLVAADPHMSPTLLTDPDRYPYTLQCTLNGATGPEATLEDQNSGCRVLVDAGNRAILLYLLGKKLLADRAGGMDPDSAGWTSDSDIRVGIWGAKREVDANLLHVLVYRLRKDLEKAGLDPWFIEKRRGAVRARLAVVDIA